MGEIRGLTAMRLPVETKPLGSEEKTFKQDTAGRILIADRNLAIKQDEDGRVWVVPIGSAGLTLKQGDDGVLRVYETNTPLPISVSDIVKTGPKARGEATASGNTEVIAPAAGKSIRVRTVCIWNNGDADNTVALRFTATGTLTYKALLTSKSGFALNLIGDYWQGAADEKLYINLSAAGTIGYTIGYEEV